MPAHDVHRHTHWHRRPRWGRTSKGSSVRGVAGHHAESAPRRPEGYKRPQYAVFGSIDCDPLSGIPTMPPSPPPAGDESVPAMRRPGARTEMNGPTDLRDKSVVVFGSTRKIGRHVALAYAAAGTNVVITGRDPASGERVEREAAELGGTAHFVQTDITDFASVEATVAAALE